MYKNFFEYLMLQGQSMEFINLDNNSNAKPNHIRHLQIVELAELDASNVEPSYEFTEQPS